MEYGPFGGTEVFKQRRLRLAEKIKGGLFVLYAHPEQIRNNDVHQLYRQDSALYYLTGFTEPESICVIAAHTGTPQTILFVRRKDPTRELWDGFRYGTEGALKYFAVDKVYPIDEFEQVFLDLLKGAEKLYYRLNENHEHDVQMLGLLERYKQSQGRSNRGPIDVTDSKQVVGEMRLIKSEPEKELLRKASEISAEGHIAAMRATKPGMWEYQIQAVCEAEFKMRGSERLGYGTIVGTGANATVLHYVFNNDKLKDGDMLLIDAGAEYGYYTGDITRTYPVNGKFTRAQRRFYEAVLKVQKATLDFIEPGKRLADVHKFSTEGLIEQMLEIGLLKGDAKKIFDDKSYTKYFPHGTSHWLGMDVHDTGFYQINGEPRTLEVGMCFTVEPGLYVPADDKEASSEFRGMGVRIEDDVCVTEKGCENFTVKAPKEIEEMEAIIGRK